MALNGQKHCEQSDCSRRGSGIQTVRIDIPAGFLEVSLCSEHRKPVLDFIASMPEHKFIKIPRDNPKTRRTTFRLTTIEEIEREKRRK